jgi:hypothetical protein
MMLGVAEEKNENGAKNFPIELHAATTEGSSIHMGIIIFFLLITNYGTTDNGKLSIPITFYVIVSATLSFNPPVTKSLIYILVSILPLTY